MKFSDDVAQFNSVFKQSDLSVICIHPSKSDFPMTLFVYHYDSLYISIKHKS